jgi:hypothetical protein
MAAAQRPLLVTLLGWLLILGGSAQFILHASRIRLPLHFWDVFIPLFELILLAAGVFLLRGSNWARWLAAAWIGFHIGVGFLNSVSQGLIHSLIFGVFVWLLFRPEVNAWFRMRRDAVRA